MVRLLSGLGLTAALVSIAGSAHADPQWNAAWLTGVCGRGDGGDYWEGTCWFNGARGDVLFLRERNSDFGFGPHIDITSSAFDDVKLGGGATLHVPAHPFVPIVLSAGAYARHSDRWGWEPGVAGWMFVGSRSYNFHSSYVIAAGLMLGLQRGLGDSEETAIIIGLQVDALLLALPLVMGVEWLRGPPDASDTSDTGK